MSYENKHVFRDGAITLYTRNGQPTYHCRLKIDGHKGYVVKSTKKTELVEAARIANDLYDDLRYKVRHGLEVKPHNFESMWKRWLKSNRNLLSDHRIRYFEGTANRYFLPYFGSMSLEQLSDANVAGYWEWRLNYWTSPDGQAKIGSAQKTRSTDKRPYKQKLGNVAKVPSQKTLQMEQSALRQILRWANNLGMMNRMPTIKAPRIHRNIGVSRRPAFELDEWQVLYRYLRDWVEESYDPAKPDKRPNSMHKWQRQLIRAYILFMGNSGLRPNEARQLRWRDVEYFKGSDGETRLVLHIAPTTKTGSRECVPLENAKKYLERIKVQSNHTKPDDLIFCDRDGNPIENFGKTFKKILIDTGLLKDRHGKDRTIYSLRHTYATFRLLYGDADVQLLAQNMGTSPAQIYSHYRHITVRQKAKDLSGKLRPEMSRKGLYF
jgi:integrase